MKPSRANRQGPRLLYFSQILCSYPPILFTSVWLNELSPGKIMRPGSVLMQLVSCSNMGHHSRKRRHSTSSKHWYVGLAPERKAEARVQHKRLRLDDDHQALKQAKRIKKMVADRLAAVARHDIDVHKGLGNLFSLRFTANINKHRSTTVPKGVVVQIRSLSWRSIWILTCKSILKAEYNGERLVPNKLVRLIAYPQGVDG